MLSQGVSINEAVPICPLPLLEVGLECPQRPRVGGWLPGVLPEGFSGCRSLFCLLLPGS